MKFFINDEPVETISFPITEVGDQSLVTLTVKNDNEEKIELIPKVEDREVAIIEYPRHLAPDETGKSLWVFSPIKERRKSLKAKAGFQEIIG